MDMVTGKLRDAECQLDQKANEYSQAKVQYQSAARALEDKLSILTADLHNSCERSNSLEDQLNATHMEMKDLRESLDTVHAQKMEADQFNADLQKKKDVFEVQVHDLSDQLDVVSKGREEALTQVNVLLAEKSTLECKLTEFERNMAELVNKSAHLEQELESRVDLLRQKEDAVSQLKSDLEVALSNQETATVQLNDLLQQQEKDGDEQSRIAKMLTEAETEKEQLSIEVKGIKEVLIDLKSELEASRIEEIELRSQLEVALIENEQIKYVL
jgi:chromosome segregation ATPase